MIYLLDLQFVMESGRVVDLNSLQMSVSSMGGKQWLLRFTDFTFLLKEEGEKASLQILTASREPLKIIAYGKTVVDKILPIGSTFEFDVHRVDSKPRRLIDQRDLIEKREWTDLIILDACRHDSLAQEYPRYVKGKLLKVYNGGVTWTFDWFMRTFRDEYDAVLYTAAPLAVKKTFHKRGWVYPNHFREVVGHRVVNFDPNDISKNCRFINEAVTNHKWTGKRVIRYLSPHPPFPGLPWTMNRNKQNRARAKIIRGDITLKEFRKAYVQGLRYALEAVTDLMPHLGEKVVITSDHGECLGDCGQFFHGASLKPHDHLVYVPWLEVKATLRNFAVD